MGTTNLDPVDELRAMLDAGQDITEHPNYGWWLEKAVYDRAVCRETMTQATGYLVQMHEAGESLPRAEGAPPAPEADLGRLKVDLAILTDDALAERFIAASNPADVERLRQDRAAFLQR